MTSEPTKPEILAPVGNFEMSQAVVHNCADGRSANCGQCAQTCRLPYGLLAVGQLL